MKRLLKISWVSLGLLAGAGMGLAVGCGAADPGGGGGSGPICYTNDDCVPNGCCGTGTGSVEKSQAPNCASQTCSNSCPPTEVNCGCGIPTCQDSHCTVASTTGGTCGASLSPLGTPGR